MISTTPNYFTYTCITYLSDDFEVTEHVYLCHKLHKVAKRSHNLRLFIFASFFYEIPINHDD